MLETLQYVFEIAVLVSCLAFMIGCSAIACGLKALANSIRDRDLRVEHYHYVQPLTAELEKTRKPDLGWKINVRR